MIAVLPSIGSPVFTFRKAMLSPQREVSDSVWGNSEENTVMFACVHNTVDDFFTGKTQSTYELRAKIPALRIQGQKMKEQ